jgi:tetratricopeptide (TPR) repeat protein
MKGTFLTAALVLAAGAAAAVAWNLAARDRDYRRMIAAGEAALASDQTRPAVEAFSGAIALKPDSMLAYLKRGETYRRIGDLKAALRDLRQANAIDPSATRTLEELGDVQSALGHDDRARARYESYVAIDDRAPQVLYKLALARYRLGQAAEAVGPLRQAIRISDRFAEAHYLLGLCLDADAHPREALSEFERAVALAPALMPARDALATAYRTAGRRDDAIEQLEALAALDHGHPDRRLALALAYADAGRTDMAVTTLRRASERFPDSVAVYATLGEVWLRVAETRGDRVALEKAVEALRTAVVRGGSASRDLALFGRGQLLKGDYAGALRALGEAATKLPVEPETFRYLAAAAIAQGETRQARDALVRYTILLAGASPPREVARQIGSWSLQLRDPATAARWLARAVDPARIDPQLLAELAEAELGAGRTDAARATVERGLDQAPTNQRLLKLRARLQRS